MHVFIAIHSLKHCIMPMLAGRKTVSAVSRLPEEFFKELDLSSPSALVIEDRFLQCSKDEAARILELIVRRFAIPVIYATQGLIPVGEIKLLLNSGIVNILPAEKLEQGLLEGLLNGTLIMNRRYVERIYGISFSCQEQSLNTSTGNAETCALEEQDHAGIGQEACSRREYPPRGLTGLLDPVGLQEKTGCWKGIETTASNLYSRPDENNEKNDISKASASVDKPGHKLIYKLKHFWEALQGHNATKTKCVFVKKSTSLFWSPVPGAGARETAVNTAILLARQGRGDVCIIDLDWMNPSLDCLLDVKQSIDGSHNEDEGGLSSLEAYINHTLDKNMQERDVMYYLHRHARYKKLYAATGLYKARRPDSEKLDIMLDFVHKCHCEFEHVVVIGPPGIENKALVRIISQCDQVYCVLEADMFHLRRAAWYLNDINGMHYLKEDKLFIILNKYDEKQCLSPAQIRRLYGYKVAAVISYSPLHAGCRNRGHAFVEECEKAKLEEYTKLLENIGYIPQ